MGFIYGLSKNIVWIDESGLNELVLKYHNR